MRPGSRLRPIVGVVGLVVHDEDVVYKVEAVRPRLEGVLHHLERVETFQSTWSMLENIFQPKYVQWSGLAFDWLRNPAQLITSQDASLLPYTTFDNYM